MKNLISGKLLLLLFSQCSAMVTGCFAGSAVHPVSQDVPVSWFIADTGHFLMTTRIDVLKNHFSGLLVIKPQPVMGHRVVMITEVGLKIFDLEFSPGAPLKVHYVMAGMDRKPLLRILDRDFRMVLMTETGLRVPKRLQDSSSGMRVLQYKKHGMKERYSFEPGSKRPGRAEQVGRFGRKALAEFYGSPDGGIDSVRISHDHIKLRIGMFRVK